MIQQIVDELGNLRHVILSPETTPTGLIPVSCAVFCVIFLALYLARFVSERYSFSP